MFITKSEISGFLEKRILAEYRMWILTMPTMITFIRDIVFPGEPWITDSSFVRRTLEMMRNYIIHNGEETEEPEMETVEFV